MVLVGDDRIIPHRRLRDETLVANERKYFDEVSTHTYLESAFQYRYISTSGQYPSAHFNAKEVVLQIDDLGSRLCLNLAKDLQSEVIRYSLTETESGFDVKIIQFFDIVNPQSDPCVGPF